MSFEDIRSDPALPLTGEDLADTFRALALRLHERVFDPDFDSSTKAALTIVSNEIYKLANDLVIEEPDRSLRT